MTPEERAEVRESEDGEYAWVTVRACTDGGSLRLGDGEGDRIDLDEARDLRWEKR